MDDSWADEKYGPCSRLFRQCCPQSAASCRSWYSTTIPCVLTLRALGFRTRILRYHDWFKVAARAPRVAPFVPP
eukprot:5437558-Pleurochrysis_carterae.AAC.1